MCVRVVITMLCSRLQQTCCNNIGLYVGWSAGELMKHHRRTPIFWGSMHCIAFLARKTALILSIR
eukprot:COSAG01_NODE_741_length_13888_cov_119.430996_9_plen_65_part_00